jgi:two-component system, OmpR family, response regulator ChvI
MNSLADNNSRYDDFPIARNSAGHHSWNISTTEEISFSGHRQDCGVCFIDMINSTKIAADLHDAEIRKYYSIFLNSMAKITRNFGAKIIKSAGDCLIYYFPDTSELTNQSSFKDLLECGITMIWAHRAINSKLQEESLPSLDFRISADYGEVQFAKSTSSQGTDLFGSTVNLCAKINSKAPPNGLVIGNNLYEIVKSFDEYLFEEVEGYTTGLMQKYSVYFVQTKQKRNILDPFSRISERVHQIHSFSAPPTRLRGNRQHKNAASIILVDDDPNILITFKSFLAKEGYNIEEYTDSKEALQHIELNPSYFDLVITDIKMPTFNGLELYQRIRTISTTTKVLFVTAIDATDILVNVYGVSPNEIIRKPIYERHFIEKVKSTLAEDNIAQFKKSIAPR